MNLIKHSALALALLGCEVVAQPTQWLQRVTSTMPSARALHSTAYDARHKSIVLFGGNDQGGTFPSDTWLYDGNNWSLLGPPQRPSRRISAAMCYDSRRERCVLFGGVGPGLSVLGDTWEWDGSTWSLRTPAVVPPARDGAMMAFDEVRGVSVLFGGGDTQQQFTDTWEWDGANWSQRAVGGYCPSQRSNGAMCYNADRQVITLFGGGNGVFPMDSGLWEWNGKEWLGPKMPAVRPAGRVYPACAYDDSRRKVVFYGGYYRTLTGLQNYFTDVWEWDGLTWVNYASLSPFPMSSVGASLEWFPPRRGLVLFGGFRPTQGLYYAETWEYQLIHAAQVSSSGMGCLGSGGVPTVYPLDESLPWIGTTFASRIGNLGTGTGSNLAFGIVGNSTVTWGSTSLPLDLGVVGMGGCLLYTNPVISTPLQNVGGSAAWSLSIPGDHALAGVPLYLQGGVISPGANVLGVVMSNLTTLQLGER